MIKTINQEPIRYEEYWVIRIIQYCGGSKKVYDEIRCKNEPTEKEIVNALIGKPANCFAVTSHNYALCCDDPF